eukprot:CAMPEP_0196811224 /NCGR_PEP_ID=MMETSP1362-20130617/17023_1 /TAXON_ID=163516 /ORGANISM="Leptocylindrus danicus, Strain CCMP1856" /LENGTH=205 /DNA_ID=CAMNT_0042186493 /DNA_START=137 /DNA_END=754 /DNA_ORIENTATION=+
MCMYIQTSSGQGLDVYAHNSRGPLTYDVSEEILKATAEAADSGESIAPDVYADSIMETGEDDSFEMECGEMQEPSGYYHPCVTYNADTNEEEMDEECLAAYNYEVNGYGMYDDDSQQQFAGSCSGMEEAGMSDEMKDEMVLNAAWIADMAAEMNMSVDAFVGVFGTSEEKFAIATAWIEDMAKERNMTIEKFIREYGIHDDPASM